jgi:hypothetical protein
VCDFTSIGNLLNGQTGTAGNVVFDNFKALRDAMVAAGGDIDAIDFDNEDNLDASVMINFANTLVGAGYTHVTFCPYNGEQIWYDTMQQLVKSYASHFCQRDPLAVLFRRQRQSNFRRRLGCRIQGRGW